MSSSRDLRVPATSPPSLFFPMTNKKDARDLGQHLAQALRTFADQAEQPDQTAANHLAKQLEENENASLQIELDKGEFKLRCVPLKHTVRRRKRRKPPPRDLP